MHKIIKTGALTAGLGTIAFILMGASSCDTSGGNAAGSSGNNGSGVKTVAQGQPMTDSNGKSVTVTSVQHGYSTGNQFEVPAAGNECVRVGVSLTNGSKDEWLLPMSDLSVVDASGQKYTEGSNCGLSTDISSLVAGGHATGFIGFEVPKGSALNFTFNSVLAGTVQSLLH